MSKALGSMLVVLVALGVPARADMRRDMSGFFALALRSVSAKNLALDGACDVGVVCARPSRNSECGTASFEDATFGDGSQIGADAVTFNTPGASVFQLFANSGPGGNVTVRHGPVGAAPMPLIAGMCGAGCTPDVAAVEAACDFPAPFPACDPGRRVVVPAGSDCPNGLDASPGNARCDLSPGTYGDVIVRDDAKLDMAPGTYVLCSLQVGKHAIVTGTGVVVDVADGGALSVSNLSKLGAGCGDFTVRMKGAGALNLGKDVTVAADVCAPGARLALGRGNDLLGRFVGDTIVMDRFNRGKCCECPPCPAPPP